jgi:hypothetical protein
MSNNVFVGAQFRFNMLCFFGCGKNAESQDSNNEQGGSDYQQQYKVHYMDGRLKILILS